MAASGMSRETRSRDRGPWIGEGAEIGAHFLDRDVLAAPDEVPEVGEVRLRARQQELVLGRAEDDPVLDHEAALVQPDGVLGIARRAGPDVASQDAGEERFRVTAVDAVLEQRRRVEDAGRVADGEVLELVGDLVALGGQVARPVAPQPGLVQRVRALVEG